MNRLAQNIFLVLYPAYPFLAWALHLVTDKPLNFLLNILLIPLVLNFLFSGKRNLPNYLVFLLAFTCYHLVSAFINDAIPSGANKVYFVFADTNLLACNLFIIIANTEFSEKFIGIMNRNILLVVIISLIVSIIQINNPVFFVNTTMIDRLTYLEGEDRIGSIYTWVNSNSIGITFPILISILLNFYTTKNLSFYLIILSGIVVAFLSKGRYVMLSAIVIFSQLFFGKRNSLANKISIIAVFAGSFFLVIYGAKQVGYNIDEVIANRILEKETDMASAKARILSYEVFLKKFPENPFFGVGPATRNDVLILLQGEAPLIHVGFLCYLYYYGIIGCFLIFTAIYYLLREAWDAGIINKYWGTFYGLISFCLANLAFVYFEFSEMGMVLAVIYLRYFSLRSSSAAVSNTE